MRRRSCLSLAVALEVQENSFFSNILAEVKHAGLPRASIDPLDADVILKAIPFITVFPRPPNPT